MTINERQTLLQNNTRPITILSLNVGRGAQNHEVALNEAYLSSADIVLIQEPYIFRERLRRLTKRHPSYHCFSPIDDWTKSRPRVITYVRKKSSLQAEQIHTFSNDILILRLNASSGKILNIFNIYNAPNNLDSNSAINILYKLPRSSFRGSCLLQGDFNLHHTRWQPSWNRSPSPGAENFVEWADAHNFTLISPLDKPTHNRGNVLDLALGSGPLSNNMVSCIATNLAVTSDHLPILTTVGWNGFVDSQRKLRPDTLDPILFKDLLSTSITGIAPLSEQPTIELLDKLAKDLTDAIYKAYSGSARFSLNHGKGNPWWNDICTRARQEFKLNTQNHPSPEELKEEKKTYRQVIRKAKALFYKTKLEEISTSKEIFAATKWHKSIGSYRSSPIKDPRHPERPPVTDISEKRDILLNNLLVNSTEVGDVPTDIPVVPSRSLKFPQITTKKSETAYFGLRILPRGLMGSRL